MKSKTTIIWFMLAALLFAGIWLSNKFLQPAAPSSTRLLAGLRASELTAVQISPAGALEIDVVRTNHAWQLQKPIAYPAQAAAIESLADALEKLVPATRLTAAEISSHKNTDADFGFENPQYSLVIVAGEQRWQLLVGKKTAPGDQVFIRVVGLDGAFVTDAGWLQLLPRSMNEWRDKALVDVGGATDWLVITNGAKAMEFRRDPTNQLWRMIRPLAARADGARITAALQQLQAGRVAQFVTDDARADLSSYGLQPADLDVWLGHGTNFTTAIHAGKNPVENSALVFARREGWNTVVTAAKDIFAAWHGAVNDFRDPHLLTFTAPAVAEIEVRGENHFTLQRQAPDYWTVAGEKFSADNENVQNFLKLLGSLRVAEFVKDVVTVPDLQGFGFTPSSPQIILRGTAGDTNSVLAQLIFGTNEPSRVLVKRGDEDFIYAIKPEDFARLPEAGWEFRDRRIWNFAETNIAQVTLRQNGKTREMIRTGNDKWSLGANSQGIINPPAIEETMHRLGELTAAGWVAHNVTAPEKFGLNTNNLSITVELKTGGKLSVDFGAELAKAQTALAAVNFDGDRWVFVFPPVLYQFVTTYLTIPPSAP
ncbi:MAG TPA: DUF4340 domain-containing protein [Verrucomicrobiae bacterium]